MVAEEPLPLGEALDGVRKAEVGTAMGDVHGREAARAHVFEQPSAGTGRVQPVNHQHVVM